jgi:hypothetical protein
MKTISSIFALTILVSGCALQKTAIKTDQKAEAAPDIQQEWENADITSLPFSKEPQVLADLAKDLSTRFSSYGQKQYALRLATYASEQDSKNKNIALTLAIAAFFLADNIDGDEIKVKKIADMGVKAARTAGVSEANPEACYYFALNQGLIVQNQGLLALGKLPEIANALKIAQKAESIDYGGPLRVLGILYLKAPAWPSGIGDLDKALELLEKSVKKYPYFPQNLIFYADALIEDDNKDKAREVLETAYRLSVPEIWGLFYSQRWRAQIDELIKKITK